jgi:hypothetical protein
MYCYVVASLSWWSSGRTRTPTKSSRLLSVRWTDYGPLFAEYQDVAQHKEESGKHQLIMTASMKVIRAVAPSGGPDGHYRADASSSTEYGPLFAEYQDVAQHKEEVIRTVAPFGGPTTEWAAAGLEDEASSIQPAAS